MKQVDVVGAVITNELGEILCALRSKQMSSPGVWEFPGGKIERGETPEESLKREIREELACEVDVGSLIVDTFYEYPDLTVHLMTFYARIVSGIPKAKEHERLAWLKQVDLRSLQWAPADIPTVEKLLQRED